MESDRFSPAIKICQTRSGILDSVTQSISHYGIGPTTDRRGEFGGMATIDDVSKRAGVSRSTVSRVVADNGYVSEEKRRAIQLAIAELGYRPNTLAQALRSNRSNMIGAVVGVQPFGGEGLSGTGPKAGGPNTLFAYASERVRSTDVTATGGNLELLKSPNIPR